MRRAAFIGALLLAYPLSAKEGGHVAARLLSEASAVKPGDRVWLGIHLKMAPHWHTYWKNPGDSGMATRVQWTLPEGVSAGPIHWPAPKRIEMPPLVSFGYEDEVLLLVPLDTREARGKSLAIAAKVDWLECEEVCIPGQADLKLTLPLGPATVPELATAELFSRFRFRLPLENSGWQVAAEKSGAGARLSLTPPAGDDGSGRVNFFPDDPEVMEASAVQKMKRRGGKVLLEFPLAAQPASAQITGVLVSETGWRGPGSEPGLEVKAPFTAGPAERSLLLILLFAFAGGLLLNLMPCVLPVLSLKAFGLLHDASLSPALRRRQGWLYTAGVVVSFWALAALLLALRAGGEQLGWGFHLQSPRFVICLVALFAVMAMNLWGAFELGTGLMAAGAQAERKRGWGSFGSGVLATVVATPCTAPFMGTAVGVALAQPPAVALGVFTSLALGMAFPYWLLTALPGLARWLPKPGPWMDHMKKFLGLLLAGTAAWLLWVLRIQTPSATLPMAFLLASIAAACVAGGRAQRGAGPWPLRVLIVAALAAGAWTFRSARVEAPPAGAHAQWEAFSPERVAALEKAGTPYFIDFTAAWCLTCQVNKRTTLERPEVIDAFRQSGVTLLRADWTNRNGTIAEALTRLGRSGVPVYVLKGPSEAPVLLPTLLTPAAVLEALKKLKPEEVK